MSNDVKQIDLTDFGQQLMLEYTLSSESVNEDIDLSKKFHSDEISLVKVYNPRFNGPSQALVSSLSYSEKNYSAVKLNIFLFNGSFVPKHKIYFDTFAVNPAHDSYGTMVLSLNAYYNFAQNISIQKFNSNLANIFKMYYSINAALEKGLHPNKLLNIVPNLETLDIPTWLSFDPEQQMYAIDSALCMEFSVDNSHVCNCVYRTERLSKTPSLHYPYAIPVNSVTCGNSILMTVAKRIGSLSYCNRGNVSEITTCSYYQKDAHLITTVDLISKESYRDSLNPEKAIYAILSRKLECDSYVVEIYIKDLKSSVTSLIKRFDYTDALNDFSSSLERDKLIEEVHTQVSTVLLDYQQEYAHRINKIVERSDQLLSVSEGIVNVSYIEKIYSNSLL